MKIDVLVLLIFRVDGARRGRTTEGKQFVGAFDSQHDDDAFA